MPDSKNAKSRINPGIVQKAYDYVVDLLTNQLSGSYCFHNIEHTKEVLKYVTIIGKYHELSNHEMNILKISAIFHDTGYIKTYKGHEEEGVKIAKNFLETNYIKESQIKKVEKIIMSTKVPQKPDDLLSKILCDADLINLTYDNYFESAELMRQEWWNIGFAKMDELEFHNNSVKFFNSHEFRTEYAKKYLQPKKKDVLGRIQKRQAEIRHKQKL